MTAITQAGTAGEPDLYRLIELHARYFDIIDRYVRHRAPCRDQAGRVVDAVFQHAAAHLAEIPDPPLPWLIATARHECAEARRRALEVA
jgi:DNA-directed RNA polymerase specialized sigma24 family protein